MRRLLCLALLLLLSACQAKSEQEEASPRTLPVERPSLSVSLLSDSAMVARVGEEWARSQGMDLKLIPREQGQSPPPEVALVELEDGGGQPWLLAPYGLFARLDLLQESGQSTRCPDSWQALAVLVRAMESEGKALGIPQPSEGLHRLFLPLYWAARGVESQEAPRLDAPAAEGALAYLVALSQRAQRAAPDELKQSFLAGELAFLACDLNTARSIQDRAPQFRLQLWPWPAEEGGRPGIALALARSWKVPADSPQPELATSLKTALTSPRAAKVIEETRGAWMPAANEGGETPALLTQLQGTLHPWPRGKNALLLSTLLDQACDAALDRRRSPRAALAEAKAAFDSKADLSP